ncbi:hypothetical protein RFI_39601, partial [Reticulomyxa filosa]
MNELDELQSILCFYNQHFQFSNKNVKIIATLKFFVKCMALKCVQTFKKKRDKWKKKEEFLDMSFQASVCIESKSSEVTLSSLSLESLEAKVKELISNRAELKAKNPPHFKITDINGQNIDNDQKLRIVFATSPVRLFIHFIHKNNDEDTKYPDDEKQDIKNIELYQNKPWIKANKTAHTIVEQMIRKKQKGIVIVSTNLDQFAKSNDRWFFQDIDFSMMINSNKYMKEKKVISPYV